MKNVTLKKMFTVTGAILVVPFFAVTLIVGAHASAMEQGAQNDLLVIALALGGAAASIINGFGRRAGSGKVAAQRVLKVEARANASRGDYELVNLGS
jgi:uncharacterized YccA/Bax inhibitor family protein